MKSPASCPRRVWTAPSSSERLKSLRLASPLPVSLTLHPGRYVFLCNIVTTGEEGHEGHADADAHFLEMGCTPRSS